jgi:hypothetical protein
MNPARFKELLIYLWHASSQLAATMYFIDEKVNIAERINGILKEKLIAKHLN